MSHRNEEPHPSEEELVAGFYEGVPASIRLHLNGCAECDSLARHICETLAAASEAALPERGKAYGSEVWARLSPQLPSQTPPRRGLNWWLWAPASAVFLALVFSAGMFTEHRLVAPPVHPKVSDDTTSKRVLYLALSDHLDQAQAVLTELAHARPAFSQLDLERVRARDLITQNRLLQQRIASAGDSTDSAVLDDLERVLLQVANSDTNLEAVQQRMEAGNLLFRVRIRSTDARTKGGKL